MSTETFEELAPREQLRLVWAFFWRALLASIGGGVVGAIVGFIIGFTAAIVAGILGYDIAGFEFRIVTNTLGVAVGVVIGLVVWWQYIRWLFRSRLSAFRLRLIREVTDAAV